MKTFIGIPTYNGGGIWHEAAESIRKNSPPNTYVQIIDSGSTDDTNDVSKKYDFDILSIDAKDFNHGRTRNIIVERHIKDFDVVIFLTQDAVPEPGFVEKVTAVFNDPLISCAYGRQLPHLNANEISCHARFFNYPNTGYIAAECDIPTMGLKTAFSSNSFAAYRTSYFKLLGGFPDNTILSEDMYYAAKSILKGYKVAYVAESVVRHSHNYSFAEEFRRYFDIGVFHATEKWIRDSFGGAGGEGKKFLLSEFKYLCKNRPFLIPKSVINNFAKILGYKLGQHYIFLNKKIVRKLSMHKRYWDGKE